MYAESTEILFVESTNILEHILRLFSGIQERRYLWEKTELEAPCPETMVWC